MVVFCPPRINGRPFSGFLPHSISRPISTFGTVGSGVGFISEESKFAEVWFELLQNLAPFTLIDSNNGTLSKMLNLTRNLTVNGEFFGVYVLLKLLIVNILLFLVVDSPNQFCKNKNDFKMNK